MGVKNPEQTAGPSARLARQGEYTIAQAADRIGRSAGTVRRWVVSGKINPRRIQCGQQSVAVFNKAELADLRAFSKSTKVGRPRAGSTPLKKAPAKKKAAAKKAPAKKKAGARG